MTLLTARQVAGYWVGAGGPKSRAAEFVAIAMGESGLVTDAVSPVGAIGIWQVMPFNAPPYGYTPGDLYDPAVNARVTVALSGGGTNCAAWDTCYRDIQASGRYSFLPWPESGSVAYNNLPAASAELGGASVAPIGSPSQPGVDDTLAATAAALQKIAGQLVPAQTVTAARAGRVISGLYR